MQTITIEVAIPDEFVRQFEARVVAHHGDAQKYVQEIVSRDLFSMSDIERQRLIDSTFEEIDMKYGEALKNLAK